MKVIEFIRSLWLLAVFLAIPYCLCLLDIFSESMSLGVSAIIILCYITDRIYSDFFWKYLEQNKNNTYKVIHIEKNKILFLGSFEKCREFLYKKNDINLKVKKMENYE